MRKPKKCSKCKLIKPITDYYCNKNTKDGRMSECKICKKIREKKLLNNEDFRKKLRIRLKRFKKTHKGRLVNNKYLHNLRKRNPETVSARDKVKYAKQKGILIQKPCEVCGDFNSNAHHPNYKYPLLVRWLCKYHHNEIHGLVWEKEVISENQ